MKDDFGDRMKAYESTGTSAKLMPLLPAICRLDGKAFHTFCKGLERPYDKRLSDLMVEVTESLVMETNAHIGYTQSDEITLVLYADTYKSQLYFGGRVFKMVSMLAARASVMFNRRLPHYLPEKAKYMPTFDCRVWNVPSKVEAVNTVLWREQDATRNSISMAAQSEFSHSQLQGKNCSDMQEMLHGNGINWNDYPAFFKRGTYVRRVGTSRPFTSEEIENLPPKHEARTNPELTVHRNTFGKLDMPILSTVLNRERVFFEGERPYQAGSLLKV